ncbi:MAG: DUF2905 domain-containing protein [Deltaproteobacteria bacterium]
MLGRTFIIIGLIIVFIGILLVFANKIPFIGRLPGDIYYKKDDFVFYFPLATSIIVSIILSVIFYFLNRR